MSNFAIRVFNLGKKYKLGVTHSGSIRELINRSASKLIGRSNNSNQQIRLDSNERVDSENCFWALKDISFDVPKGEVLGIIGKNGAGKSTLLKILSQITSPTTGQMELRGRVAALLEVGTGFHAELTGRENVYLNGTVLGMSKKDVRRHFDSIVDFAGVEKFIDTPVKRYSSGMTVRLGFAVAAHLEPEILIVDEVLAVGDFEFQKKCIEKMDDVAKSGRTVLFVSHNLASIRALTTKALLISNGELKEIGDTKSVVNYYLSPELQMARGNDVSSMERPYSAMDRSIEFLELEHINSKNFLPIISNGDLEIRANLRFKKPCNDFQFGLTIFGKSYEPIGSTFSPTISSETVGSEKEYQLKISIPMLAVGVYHCAISLMEVRSNGNRLYDSLNDVLQFEVPPGKMEKRTWKQGWGDIRFDEIESSTLC